jgi:colanic acid biosynthesis glycosyl transferase WcaI
MHILFLTDNFPPETNAPASRTFEHARHWVAAGHRVTVVTGAPNFPSGKIHAGYRNALWSRETMDGIDVVRVWTYITANEGFLKRTLDYVSFMVAAILASPFLPRPDDRRHFAAVLHALRGTGGVLVRRCPFVFELRDLWPDSIVAVGAMRETAAIRALRKLEYFLYRRAARIVSVTQSFKRVLTAMAYRPDKIAVVPNGVDLEAYQPGPNPVELVASPGVEGKFVAAYVGTVGMAHGIGTLLDAARALRERSDIAFVVVGTGAQQAELAAKAQAGRPLERHLRWSGEQGRGPRLLAALRRAVVLLRDTPLFRHVIPSKMFEAMGMERAIVLGVKGESEEILLASGAGVTVPPEDAPVLADAVARLADDRASCDALGRKGRSYAAESFNRENLASAMLDVLKNCRIQSA